jgi:hypothetical protein
MPHPDTEQRPPTVLNTEAAALPVPDRPAEAAPPRDHQATGTAAGKRTPAARPSLPGGPYSSRHGSTQYAGLP